MTGRLGFKVMCAAASVAAFGWTAPAGAADTGSAAFDRQTQSLSRQLQREEIVIEMAAATPDRRLGAAGRSGAAMERGGVDPDSGSAWFDSYVEQVNRQLRLQEQPGE